MSRPYRSDAQPPKRPYPGDSRRPEESYRNGSARPAPYPAEGRHKQGQGSYEQYDGPSRGDREAARQKRRRGGPDDEYGSTSAQHRDSSSYDAAEATGRSGERERSDASAFNASSSRPRHGIDSDSNPLGSAEVGRDDTGDLSFDLEDEETEQRRIEEQRRRRKELMERYKDLESNEPTSATSQGPDGGTKGEESALSTANTSRARTRSPSLEPAAPSGKDADFDLSKNGQREIQGAPEIGRPTSHDDVSAADYDPVADRKRDGERETRRLQNPAVSTSAQGLAEGVGEPATRLAAKPVNQVESESEYEEVEVDDEEDDDDMFAVSSEAKKKKVVRIKKSKASNGQAVAATRSDVTLPSHGGLTDNWDDSEGYYRIVLGEKIGPSGRFHVFANLGKGMFSEVVRAKDLGEDGKGTGDKEVAIKIVRSQETMYKAGLKEIGILKKLSGLDPEDKRHVVRLISHFEHRGHLCMVFESLSMNLREVVKRFGKDVGLNLRAVRAYAHQMFLSLALMKKAEVMHADIKPDNILVNEAKTMLKICDLGSASDLTEMEITPYLVSRFYRAPEIILGQPYDCSLDMWSIGCTLYELYTGKILFPGRSNNQMLLLMQELKGRFTTRQIKKGKFAGQHFDESNAFLSRETDKNTGNETIRKVVLSTTSSNNDLRSRLLPSSVVRGFTEDEVRLTQHFVDLLNKTLELDPARRITPNEALKHPFLN